MSKLILLFLLCVLVVSCNSDTNPEPSNCFLNGRYDTGIDSCVCNEFYAGQYCDKEARASFVGVWNTNLLCDGIPDRLNIPLAIDISKGESLNELVLKMSGFFDDDYIVGTLIANDTLIIQKIDNDFSEVSGVINTTFIPKDDKMLIRFLRIPGGACFGVISK